MIKSVSVVLGYLFTLSSVYYLVYFGGLQIDVFQYMSIDDIIKGIVYPLKVSVSFFIIVTIILSTGFVVGYISEESKQTGKVNRKFKRSFLLYSMIGLFINALTMSILCYYRLSEGDTKNTDLIASSAALGFATFSMMAYGLADDQFNSYKKEANDLARQDGLEKVLNYVVLGVAIYFLASSISFGMLNVNRLKKGKEYDYTTGIKGINVDSLGLNSHRLIYLGAISDKYLFSDIKNIGKQHIVLDKEMVPALNIIHYRDEIDASPDTSDSQSWSENKFIIVIGSSFLVCFLGVFLALLIKKQLDKKKQKILQ